MASGRRSSDQDNERDRAGFASLRTTTTSSVRLRKKIDFSASFSPPPRRRPSTSTLYSIDHPGGDPLRPLRHIKRHSQRTRTPLLPLPLFSPPRPSLRPHLPPRPNGLCDRQSSLSRKSRTCHLCPPGSTPYLSPLPGARPTNRPIDRTSDRLRQSFTPDTPLDFTYHYSTISSRSCRPGGGRVASLL